MNTSHELVAKFWSWFERNQGEIAEALNRGDEGWLRDNLSERVRSLQTDKVSPKLNWEVGPGNTKKWSFVISPTVRDNIEITTFVVTNAPELGDWEFHHVKPPKREQQFSFQLSDESGNLLEIDASNWHYLLKKSSGLVGVLFIGKGVQHVNPTLRKRIAYILLDNVLGEEKVLNIVGEAVLLDASDVPSDAPLRPISSLLDDFA